MVNYLNDKVYEYTNRGSGSGNPVSVTSDLGSTSKGKNLLPLDEIFILQGGPTLTALYPPNNKRLSAKANNKKSLMLPPLCENSKNLHPQQSCFTSVGLSIQSINACQSSMVVTAQAFQGCLHNHHSIKQK